MAGPWEKYAQPQAAAPWAKYAANPARPAVPAEPPVIATTADGGRVYKMPDGTLSFASPGMSTSNQDTIKKLMEGATPADASTYGNVSEGGKIGTAVRSGLQGLTFGAGDEIVAAGTSALGPGTYDQELDRERARLDRGRDKFPKTALASEIGGAITMPLGGLKSTGKLGLDMARGAATGAGLSGVYGFGAGEGGFLDRAASAKNAAIIGAMLGGAFPIVGKGVQKYMQGRSDKAAIASAAKGAPSTEELRAAGNAAYKAVDDAGVQISPQAFDSARSGILGDLRANTGFDELPGAGSLTPNSARVMQIMDEASKRMAAEPTAALPFKALDQMRRQAGAAAGNVANKTDQKAGVSVIQGLDDFVAKLGPDDVVAGDVAALQDAIPKAREIWSRMSKSQKIDDAINAGGDYLSGASSGIRNQFKAILKSGKGGFSEAERTAMRRVVNGSIPEQILNLASGGLGQMATAIGGGAMGGIPGLLAGGAVAAGTRKLAEKITTDKAEIVRALIANGGIKELPQASQLPRQIIERLMQRGTAAGLQQ